MRISLSWLRELVDFDTDPEALAEALTMAGFEVEAFEDRRTWADGVVVGKILSCGPHPNADKLKVCQVDVGTEEPLNIVCGAPNAQAGFYVPVATVGTYLPMVDRKIRPANLRGVASQGMICSLAELGLAKESAGIHKFELEPALGSDVRPLLGLDDIILDLTSTANRADALSMVGIAREVAALTGTPLKLPTAPNIQISGGSEDLSVKISETQACPAYIGTAIERVRIGPSPEWLQRRLQAAGTRPINNVVDITNYILLTWGQPLHAFDRDALQMVADHHLQPVADKDKMISPLTLGVRFAEPGESLTTLDGQKRTLQPQTLLITANNQPVALAGVMGGEATEVQGGSQSLVLEAALFNPVSIRRSARSQGLRTEASARYERGVNNAELEIACRHALQLISELAGGIPVTQQTADYRTASSRSIELRLDRVHQVLGLVDSEENERELQPEEIEQILKALGFAITSTNQDQVWRVNVPPYRHRDIEREIDLIEEIARLYGYNNFCDTLPAKTNPGYLSFDQSLTRELREAFRGAGLTELIHYSLVKPGTESQVVIVNPLFTEYSALRTNLVSGLIDAFQYNLEQGNGPLNGFEIGRVFWRDEDGQNEADAVAGILGGDPAQGKWLRGRHREQPLSWFEAKGVLESVFEHLGLSVEYQPDRSDTQLHPGRTASLWIGGTRLGVFGQLHPQLRQERDLPDTVYIFELDLDVVLDAIAQSRETQSVFRPYSSYPSSARDIAFFAAIAVSVAEIERVIQRAANRAGKTLLESVELFDQYRGEPVPPGQRSLAFRLVYRAGDRTLTDEDIEPVHQKVREALEEKFNVRLRS
jgi:phenylalanyl-tRNA synthetase beta chain